MAKKKAKERELGPMGAAGVMGVCLDPQTIDNLNVCGTILGELDPSYIPGDDDDTVTRALAYFRGHLEERKQELLGRDRKS